MNLDSVKMGEREPQVGTQGASWATGDTFFNFAQKQYIG